MAAFWYPCGESSRFVCVCVGGGGLKLLWHVVRTMYLEFCVCLHKGLPSRPRDQNLFAEVFVATTKPKWSFTLRILWSLLFNFSWTILPPSLAYLTPTIVPGYCR